MNTSARYKIGIGIVFLLIIILPIVFFQINQPQNFVNFAKETSVSGNSAQLSVIPTQAVSTSTIINGTLEKINTVNLATHSLMVDTLMTIISAILFIGLFYLLVKKFLK